MYKQKLFFASLFLTSFVLFYLAGSLCLPALRFAQTDVLHRSGLPVKEQLTRLALSSLSALPFAGHAASSVPIQTPAAKTPSEKPTVYKTYAAEPTVIGDTLQVKNSSGYDFDLQALLEAPFPLSAPKVLIVHTHTSEAYAQTADYRYDASDSYRTEDPHLNICHVGDVLAAEVENAGISVIHDTTSHDYPSYSGCYNRSLETIRKNLKADPSIQIIIDLHRDAISDAEGNYLKTDAIIDGVHCAQALVVVGTDAGGLEHPYWQRNLSLGLKLQKKLCDMYPGLARPLHLRTERFNGHVSPGALLIEIGSNGNTMEEATICAGYVGKALAATIQDLAA